MWRTKTSRQRPHAALPDLTGKVLALQDHAAHAGAVLGCSYANSHEYEAELIAARRAAGAYRPRRNPWWLRFAAIAAGLIIVILFVAAIS